MNEKLELLSHVRCFEGWQNQYQHHSSALNCDMQFSVYFPPLAEKQAVPVVYWLSGLTCTDQNFSTKSGAQRIASALGVALVIPDTSPRGEGVPDDPEGAYDFGLSAGFYVNATEAPWKDHYQMYDYIVAELPTLVKANLPVDPNQWSIMGHSMGGHGALMIALRNPEMFKSVSAFSPIVNPSDCPWGQKAFSHYLGSDLESWKIYDTVQLVKAGLVPPPMLVDQGTADVFLDEQLKTEALITACQDQELSVEIRYQQDYDHSFYFIMTFLEEHLGFHAKHLGIQSA